MTAQSRFLANGVVFGGKLREGEGSDCPHLNCVRSQCVELADSLNRFVNFLTVFRSEASRVASPTKPEPKAAHFL